MKGDEPAFPVCQWVGDHHAGHTMGLTKREWYKGMALQGILANPTTATSGIFKKDGWMDADGIATACVEQADAMVAEDEQHERLNGK